jgi:hypothetical protein
VDDTNAPEECGILEGQVYRYLVKRCAEIGEGHLKKLEEKDPLRAPTHERLLRQPNLFRGSAVVVRRAVVIEVAQAELTPEYGLPGYTVLPALLVNSAHELYELRLVCPPGSRMYEKLSKGIEEGKNPVLRVSGYFMKNHAKRTNVPEEPPWRAPLLVCPEPAIERRAGTYNAYRDLVEAKMDKYLPSQPLPGPKADRRLVVELLPPDPGGQLGPPRLRVDGQEGTPEQPGFLAQAVERLKSSLPADQAHAPSAVLLRSASSTKEDVLAVLRQLADLGLRRLSVKDEAETLLPDKGRAPGPAKL